MSGQKSVLIVEDEAILAMFIELRLKRAGLAVCGTVATGEEAIELACSCHPDFVIMDIRLSGSIDGIEAAKEIQKCSRSQIIFTSGYSYDDMKEKIDGLDLLGYLIKPFDMTDVISLIK